MNEEQAEKMIKFLESIDRKLDVINNNLNGSYGKLNSIETSNGSILSVIEELKIITKDGNDTLDEMSLTLSEIDNKS